MTLNDRVIYLGDNGRSFCGALRCAGASAYYSGNDLSGQPAVPIIEPAAVREALAAGIACEGCGKAPALVVLS